MISLVESILSSTNAGRFSKPNAKYFKEGDIVVSIYQYDYSKFVRFYKVIKLRGTKQLALKRLEQKYEKGKTSPIESFAEPTRYDDDYEFYITVNDDGSLKRSKDSRWTSYYKYNGEPISSGGLFN